jgi:hypothetical protein
MRRFITRLGAWTALALLILAGAAPVDAERVPLHKVPKPVLDAVRDRFKDARIIGADKEIEDGKLVYEVALTQEGQNIDLTLTPEGAILLIEKEITAKDLPEPVAKALEDKYPKATYKVVEEIIEVQGKQETLAYYDVLLVTAQRKTLEVQVSADGKTLKEAK